MKNDISHLNILVSLHIAVLNNGLNNVYYYLPEKKSDIMSFWFLIQKKICRETSGRQTYQIYTLRQKIAKIFMGNVDNGYM